MNKFIIDTDPGVDDAQAILLAGGHAGTEISAITVVAGNVGLERTVINAGIVVDQLQQDIPIYVGCETALVVPGGTAEYVHGKDGLGDAGYASTNRPIEAEHAAVAIVRMANADPKTYTLVALAPLTNIALALKLDPDLPHKLKRLVVMGGAVTGRGNTSTVTAEFNFWADPEAAQVVLAGWQKAGVTLDLVDWEVVIRHGIAPETLAKWFALDTPKAIFYKKITAYVLNYIREKGGKTVMYAADPMAMAYAVDPSIATEVLTRYMTVATQGEQTRGQSVVDWAGRLGQVPNVNIVMSVDSEKFWALMRAGLD